MLVPTYNQEFFCLQLTRSGKGEDQFPQCSVTGYRVYQALRSRSHAQEQLTNTKQIPFHAEVFFFFLFICYLFIFFVILGCSFSTFCFVSFWRNKEHEVEGIGRGGKDMREVGEGKNNIYCTRIFKKRILSNIFTITGVQVHDGWGVYHNTCMESRGQLLWTLFSPFIFI